MTGTSIILGSPQWLWPAVAIFAAGAAFVLWSYARSRGPRGVVLACGALKLAGFAALALCLVEPLLTGSRAVPGANVFVVLVDNSQSLQVRDGDSTRAEQVKKFLEGQQAWKTRLGQDFDVRNFAFDTHLRGVDSFDGLAFDGTGSSLNTSLAAIEKRFQGRPVAGVLLISDGNATDLNASFSGPPIYPVMLPTRGELRDVAVRRVIVNQTNFEAAPVSLQAEVAATGFNGKSIVAIVTDEAGKELERQTAKAGSDRDTLNFRFQIKPEKAGVAFYRVEARPAEDATDAEVTLANNSRLVEVDRGGGPYRVLYVSGRPNWEYKYLRRSLEEDTEVQLVGLIRVARREAKFDFRAAGSGASSLFKGFDLQDPDTAERHDQPVLIRLGTKDAVELRAGFPQTAAELFAYHAIVIDDLESTFFTPDQLALLRTFVARRGGGLLMLGGPDSFSAGKYDRTPVGEVLPIYLDKPNFASEGEEFKLALTREGWLQPWVRTRKTEEDETKRLAEMTPFQNLNAVSGTKPGASVLAEVKDATGASRPALVAQSFGKGRAGAVLLGDLWRWGLKRTDAKEDDFDRSWRQTVRWLVGDVLGRVAVEVKPVAGLAVPAVRITVNAADAEYFPLDNAAVSVKISRPTGEDLTLAAEPDSREPGRYGVTFVPRESGAFRAVATVTESDGKAAGRREVGWVVQPEADEFAKLEPDREFLQSLADRTKGQLVDASGLNTFVENLPSRAAPVTEAWVAPLWHRGWYFLVTLACLAAEWGLRRRYGMA